MSSVLDSLKPLIVSNISKGYFSKLNQSSGLFPKTGCSFTTSVFIKRRLVKMGLFFVPDTFLLFCIALIISPTVCYSEIYLDVSIGDPFVFAWQKGPPENYLRTCVLQRNNQTYDIANLQGNPLVLPSGETVFSLAATTDPLECGVKVWNTTAASEGDWVLERKAMEWSVSNTAQVKLMDMLIVGQPAKTVKKTHKKNKPKKFHPKGCKAPYLSSIGSTILEWVGPETIEGASLICIAEHLPSARKFLMKPNLQDGRYSSYFTDMQKGICQLEILGEITEADSGLWRMEFRTAWKPQEDQSFCHFYVPSSNATVGNRDDHFKYQDKLITVGTTRKTARIECAKNLPYPVDYCYLVNENGKGLMTAEINRDGFCEFDAPPGNWTCAVNGATKEANKIQEYFQVISYDHEIIDEKVTVAKNGSTAFECHLMNNQPIKFCLFVSPNGEFFRPTKKGFVTNSSGNSFSKLRQGSMDKGDCGVEFQIEWETMYGKWQCAVIKMDGQLITKDIYYNRS